MQTIVAKNNNLDAFRREVNELLEGGWKVVDLVATEQHIAYGPVYTIAILEKDDPPKPVPCPPGVLGERPL